MNKREQTRQTIIESAIKLFSEKGYEHASVDDLVQNSGIAKGTYYYHFKQKEDVLMLIIKQDFEEYFMLPEKIAYSNKLSASDKIHQVLVALFSRYRSLANIESYFDNGIPNHYKTAINEIRLSRMIPIFEKIIEQGILEGEFDVKQHSVVSSIIVRGILSHIDDAITDFSANEDFIKLIDAIDELLSKVLGTKIKLNI